MAALTFFACNAIHELCDLSVFFVNSGYSFRRTIRYFHAKRRANLYRGYCRQVWLEFYRNKRAIVHPADTIDAAAAIDDEINTINTFTNTNSAADTNKNKNSADTNTNCTDTNSAATDTNKNSANCKENLRIVRRKMSNRNNVLDFAAMEANTEMSERQLRHEEAERMRQRQGSLAFDDYDDIEVISGHEVDSTFYEYVENYPVYQNDRIGGLAEGISLMITGKILKNCERFSVNLLLDNESRDVALHINPRLPQNYIVRNTKVHNVWGNEEVSSCLPFCLFRGKVFRIQILVTKQCYMISINGNHFAKYVHRVPYEHVSTLEVKGDVDDISMELSRVTYYPNRLPQSAPKEVRVVTEPSPTVNDDSGMDEGDYDDADGASIIPYEFKQIPMQLETTAERVGIELPYYGKLPAKSLVVGHCLRVEGRVKLLPHSFYINLQHGAHIWPHPTIAFHFNPRFSKQSGTMGKHVVVRNAWFNDDWAQEQRTEMDTNLRPGKTFRLAIVCAAHEYEVYVNRKLITTFTYCVEPQVVDTVYIQGDIKLWDVWLDKNSSLKSKRRKHRKHPHSKNKAN